MRIVKKYAFLGLAALFVLAACTKEDDKREEKRNNPSEDLFTANITPYGTTAKTYISPSDGLDYSCWADGDAVNINGVTQTVTLNGEAGSYTATISADGITAVEDGYLAAYPANDTRDNNGTSVTFSLPETTLYTTIANGVGSGEQSVTAPMVAYTTNRTLSFVNVGALAQFALQQSGSSDVKLKSISLSTDRPINGNYTMTYNNGDWNRNATGLNGYSRTLVYENALAVNNSPQDAYLYLPPVSGASTFSVNILLTIGGVRHHFSQTKSASINLDAGKCYDFGTLTYNVETGTLTDNNDNIYTEVIPSGSEEDPYRIGNTEEWYYWCGLHATETEAHYLLEADISASSSIADFRGTLDGGGHTVELNDHALIAHLNGGTIKNVTTEGTVKNNQHALASRNTCGSIAGYASNASIIHCVNTASITITTAGSTNVMDIGGIVGNASETTFDKCRNDGTLSTNELTSVTFNAGGIVGFMNGSSSTISNCTNRGNLTIIGESSCITGGVIGRAANLTHLYNSYSTGSVSSTGTTTGGFAGSNKGTIQNCYFYSTALYFCYKNERIIESCYHSSTNTIQNGSDPSNCAKLTTATTLQGGGSLPTQLNSNIGALGLSGASTWSASNGITVLDWELE